ncbi:MAG: branched-chain amino acid transaminase, partial [Kordiimonadaceae bacterium]|nr:branched-chain amino acid transaminase [Kordiimonadaceae bacterium]
MSMEDRDGYIWVDGELVNWRDAKVHVLSYTFMHGAGFFEGVRVYNGASGPAVFRLQDHTRRFFDSAKILQMKMPFREEEIEQAQIATVSANGLKQCYIRPLGYYDGQMVGLPAQGNGVHVAVAVWEFDDILGKDAKNDGIRVKTSSFSRHHINAAMSKAKANGQYINSMLAINEVKAAGYTDALLLDSHGYVAECTTSNIFMVRDGIISTPEKTAILEGITRDTVMTFAAERGMELKERNITRDELYCADELFVTGTAVEITPIVELDNRVIGDGRPGEVVKTFQKM